MAEPLQLELLSETEYEHKALNYYPKICPALDLSVTWDSGGRNILVYRPPSQVVSKIHQVGPPGENAPEAVAVSWKPDGQFLAVGWSDGFVRLMGLENNKAAHHIQVCENREVKITHIGWASNRIEGSSSHQVPSALKNGLLDEGIPIDLPRELTFLEIDTALPKISPLPSGSAGGGEDATVFTLRSGIEFLFQPPNPDEHDQVNVMVVGTSDGKLQLSIYDSFVIGSFESPTISPSISSQLLCHAAHPEISTHALLLANKSTEPDEVHLVPMDLPFISSSPINLSLLSSKLTTLQKLLRYLKQTQLHMQVEWKNTRELPSRFLRSVEGDLEQMETGPRTIVPALYHTVLTGHAHEPVREWLVENLAERGHKRWDKAVVAGLENLRSLVHENFLPALDRYAIILSRLRGLAQFHDTRDDIGFTATQISRLLDIVSCLSFTGHKILTYTMDELEHFTAFSTWLRFQIDRLATSSLSDELTEREAMMDTSKVLTYIERYLTQSPLSIFFDEVSNDDHAADLEYLQDGIGLLDVLDQQLKKQETGQPGMKAITHVDFLVDYAATWSNRLLKDIAEAKKRSVRFGKPIELSLGHPIVQKDMRMCKTADEEATIFTALTTKASDGKVFIFNTGVYSVNGISTNLSTTACAIDVSPRKLIDFKFLNDNTLLVLCSESDNTPKVLSIPIRSNQLSCGPYDPSNPGDIPTVTLDNIVVYSFPAQPTLRPLRMEVFEKANIRGEIPARVCLLEGNRTTLQSFAIPQI